MYLLEETEEAEEMRQKVVTLLRSKDEKDLSLAYQLIGSGGLHTDFIGTLLAHAAEYSIKSDKADSIAIQLLLTVFSEEQIQIFHSLRSVYVPWYGYSVQLAEKIEEENLERFRFLKPYWREIVRCGFWWTASNGRTCLQYKLLPEKVILDTLKNDYYSFLDLSYCQLNDLPNALAELKVKRLMLWRGNPFKYIKRKKWVNLYVQEIDELKNFAPLAKRVIGMCFPNVWKSMFTKYGKELLCTSFLKCVPQAKRDMKFYKICANQYKKERKAGIALKIYQALNKKYPYPEEIWKYKIAGCYALLKNKPQMLKYLMLHKAESPYGVQDIFRQDEDFAMFWEDKEVIEIVNKIG